MQLWLRFQLWKHNICPTHGDMVFVASPSGKGYHTCRACNEEYWVKRRAEREDLKRRYNASVLSDKE